jgi:hypothetical protein
MKKRILFLIVWMGTLTTAGQYPQKLPIDFKSFFAATATGSGSSLENGEYLGSTQDGTTPLLANQWNRGGKNTEWNGASAVIENSTLSYSSYVDNNAGKAIILNPEIGGTRATIYSLTSESIYKDDTFYLSALVNFSGATSSGDQFLSLDGNYTANQQRSRVCVKSSSNKGYFNIGLGWNSTATTWSDDLKYGTTYMIVMKVTLSASGTESASIFINPEIGGKESGETAISTVTSSSADLKKIKGIYIRQRPGLSGIVAGLRFSNRWADIVKSGS